MRGEARYPDGQMTWALRITGTLLCLTFAQIQVFDTPLTCGPTAFSFTTTSRLLPTPGPSTTPDPSTSRQAPSLRGAARSTTASTASSSMTWVSTPTTTSPAGPWADGAQASQPPHEACPGRLGRPCTWHTSQAGVAAAVHPARGEQNCPLCSQAQMQKLHRTAQGKRALTLRLKQLLAIRSSCARELWARVEEHLGAEAVKEYQRRARTPGCALFLAPHPERRRGQSESSSRCVALPRLLCSADASVASNSTRGKQALKQLLALRSTDVLRLCGLFEEHLGSAALTYYKGRAGAEPRKTVQQQWKEELKLRHSVHPLPDQEGQRVWRERAREDGRMRDKKFGLAFSEQHSGRAWMSARGAALRVLGPRSLLVHVHRVPSAGASAVPPVQPRQEHPAPSSPEKMQTLRPGHRLQGARIPGPLRDLTATALWALCSCGEYGYRIHTDMTRLRWRPQSVQDQVACEARTDAESPGGMAVPSLTPSTDSTQDMERAHAILPSAPQLLGLPVLRGAARSVLGPDWLRTRQVGPTPAGPLPGNSATGDCFVAPPLPSGRPLRDFCAAGGWASGGARTQ